MLLDRLFKSRVCALLAAAVLLLCFAIVDAGAQSKATLQKIWNAVSADDGAAVVRLIRENGVDINAPYYFNIAGDVGVEEGYATALSGAVAWARPNVVKALLDAGADPNARDRSRRDGFGKTPLMSVYFNTYQPWPTNIRAAVKTLISYGADVNAQDDYGRTALMRYARNGRHENAEEISLVLDLTKMLLDAGADVNIRNDEGLTALMIAENEGNADMAQLLRNARTYR